MRTGWPVVSLLALLAATLVPVGVGVSAASAASRSAGFERALVEQVNALRKVRGLRPLHTRTSVAGCFDEYAERTARAIRRSGTTRDRSLARMNASCPGVAVGESAARTHVRAERLVQRWMRVPARRQVILDRRARHIAVGAVRDARGIWSLDVLVVAVPSRPAADEGTTDREAAADPVTEPEPSQPPEIEQAREEILSSTNAARRSAGVGALTTHACIQRNAQRHAERLAATGTLAHQDLGDVQAECGVHRTAAENVAMNSEGSGDVMVRQWLSSRGHRSNLLASGHRYLGVGVARDSAGRWWGVQVFFGAPLS